MITAAAMRAMAAAGLSAEQIADVVEADRSETREYEAARKARYRARLKNVPGTPLCDVPGVPGTNRHIENLTSLLTIEDSLGKKEAVVVARARGGDASRDRGVRLPDEWAPDADGSIMAAEQLGPERYLRELAKFRDYWRAQPGVRGRKLDWDATFRNWIRNAGERKDNGNGRRKSVQDAARDLHEAAKRGEVDFFEDRLADQPRAFAVRLLPKG